LYAASTAPAVQQIIVVVARGLKIAGFFYKKKTSTGNSICCVSSASGVDEHACMPQQHIMARQRTVLAVFNKFACSPQLQYVRRCGWNLEDSNGVPLDRHTQMTI
jgi:hypothetical protein